VYDRTCFIYLKKKSKFKKVTSDENTLREVLLAAKAGDTDKLNEILDDL
jgi:hypothetical protein